ncbi:NADP-dependent phosphogluconate dehydrogenase [Planococcus sp. CPCC 101016]|uniref:NADP-dependent phosphogluconate dehydrogenase n=1 Tax=Planococcus sp. CPCC 101016 TaxID=2599617 RepID=UPI0011B48651|nr:NADP-dependent phosphogluconate dehydrogenase [Planococcus sp. CPCC 101016]TWT05283.1 NADP-dependent phosphogluconate dehydrogenase [Planococcus sp. CPCC 101016]
MKKQQIGIIGLGVMGGNLALNIESRGFSVSLYNRSYENTNFFLKNKGSGKRFTAFDKLLDFVESLERPRKILVIVKAGNPTDEVIESLLPHLDAGDILMDGGNSHFQDTVERSKQLKEQGIHLMDISFSGGEKGALEGPAILPGGAREAFAQVEPLLTVISAKKDGRPCFTYLGPSGTGHYVKMVHNGIEYSDMQLITEAYFILKQVVGLKTAELHEVFKEWNEGELNSYLIEITADIFTETDPDTGKALVEVILDTAAQKGTGKWASQNALDLGVPLSIITEAVFARVMSSLKDERVHASQSIDGPPKRPLDNNKEEMIEAVRKALYMSKLCAYSQGFSQLAAASEEYGWKLPYGEIAMTFKEGCIIRAQFLDNIINAYERDPKLKNLLLDPFFKNLVERYQPALRQTLSTAIQHGIPVPALSSSMAYFDSYRTANLPANLLQAQRDYFGAHTYKRTDKEGSFHTDWLKLNL